VVVGYIIYVDIIYVMAIMAIARVTHGVRVGIALPLALALARFPARPVG
jgi:hypothetical protein